MEKKEEQNYIRQLLLELEDYLFSLSWYDGEDRLKTFRDVSNIKSIFQLVPQRYLKLLEGRIYTQEELDKAREEGYEKGVKDGIKGKVFNKVEIKEEAHIPKELIEKIREEGYEKGYERGVKYGTTGNTLTDSDIEEFERLDKKERERFLKSIY